MKQLIPSLIIGAAILIGVGIYEYFSPFQSCMREETFTSYHPALDCARRS